jgi:hypothetical protein
MAKEINEKTFELNITNELLNLSKSFIWYLDHINCMNYPVKLNREIVSRFFSQAVLFAEGLTQEEEESNPSSGGYDVSISYSHPNGNEGRLMYLQFKAGVKKKYSHRKSSHFLRQTAHNDGRSPEHVMFTFNDAAMGTQHSTLRKLANSTNINPNSVLYVFPRITEKRDFKSKVGNLIPNSSFVPILEIDNQAAGQVPPITIIDGAAHKFRTSYDGLTNEVNFYFFSFEYDNKIISEILSELICIQIERLIKLLLKQRIADFVLLLEDLKNGIAKFIELELKFYPSSQLITKTVNQYIDSIGKQYESNGLIPMAPSKYTTIIPKEGFKLKMEGLKDYSLISCQVF